VLVFGIIAALVLRAVFIAVGGGAVVGVSFMFWSSGCCWYGPPCGFTVTATRIRTSPATRWSGFHAGYCLSMMPTTVVGLPREAEDSR